MVSLSYTSSIWWLQLPGRLKSRWIKTAAVLIRETCLPILNLEGISCSGYTTSLFINDNNNRWASPLRGGRSRPLSRLFTFAQHTPIARFPVPVTRSLCGIKIKERRAMAESVIIWVAQRRRRGRQQQHSCFFERLLRATDLAKYIAIDVDVVVVVVFENIRLVPRSSGVTYPSGTEMREPHAKSASSTPICGH